MEAREEEDVVTSALFLHDNGGDLDILLDALVGQDAVSLLVSTKN